MLLISFHRQPKQLPKIDDNRLRAQHKLIFFSSSISSRFLASQFLQPIEESKASQNQGVFLQSVYCMYFQAFKNLDLTHLPQLVRFEVPARFDLYRLKKKPLSPSNEPDPLMVASTLDKGGQIVTYIVEIMNYELQLVVYNVIGKATKERRDLLGRGSFGHVRREYSTEKEFAVKRMFSKNPPATPLGDAVNKSMLEDALKEYAITKICSFYELGPQVDTHIGFDILCYEDCIEFHLELCQTTTGEDLWEHEKSLMESMRGLHSIKLIHRDIKPGNILFSPSLGKYVFADYGISHFVKEVPGEKSLAYYEGTEAFMSGPLAQLKDKGPAKIDLYENDLVALNITMELSKERASRREIRLERFVSKGKISNNVQKEQSKNRLLAGGGELKGASKESSRIHRKRVVINNYEYLKLKFFLTKSTADTNLHTARCWEHLSAEEFLQLIQLIADSADKYKTQRALLEVSRVPPHRIPKSVHRLLEVIKKLAANNQFNPESAYVSKDSEKTVRFKVRVYGYQEIVIKSCQNCIEQSPYVQETLAHIQSLSMFAKKHGNPKLRRIVKLLRGSYRRRGYLEWHKIYKRYKEKSLDELVAIFSCVYEDCTKTQARALLLKELRSFQQDFVYPGNILGYNKLLATYSKVVDTSNKIGTFEQTTSKYRQLQSSIVSRVKDRYSSGVERLSLLALFDFKYLIYYNFVYVKRVPEATLLSAISLPSTQNLEIRQMERTFLYRIGKFTEAYSMTTAILDSLTDTSVEEEVLIEEMKELTYCMLSKLEFDKARLLEQRRLKMLRASYQSDDFAIVESLLLLAIASGNVESEFDSCRRSKNNALILYGKTERSPREHLVFTNLMLLLAVAQLNETDWVSHKKALDSLLSEHNLFIHFERGSLWRDFKELDDIYQAKNYDHFIHCEIIYIAFRGKNTRCFDRYITTKVKRYYYLHTDTSLSPEAQIPPQEDSCKQLRDQFQDIDQVLEHFDLAKQYQGQDMELDALRQDLSNIFAGIILALELKQYQKLSTLVARGQRAAKVFHSIDNCFKGQIVSFWGCCGKILVEANMGDSGIECFDKALAYTISANWSMDSKEYYTTILQKWHFLQERGLTGQAFAILDDFVRNVNPHNNPTYYLRTCNRIILSLIKRNLPACKKFIEKYVNIAQKVIEQNAGVNQNDIDRHRLNQAELEAVNGNHWKALKMHDEVRMSCRDEFIQKRSLKSMNKLYESLRKFRCKYWSSLTLLSLELANRNVRAQREREYYVYQAACEIYFHANNCLLIGSSASLQYYVNLLMDVHGSLKKWRLDRGVLKEINEKAEKIKLPYISMNLSTSEFGKRVSSEFSALSRKEHKAMIRIKAEMLAGSAPKHFGIVHIERLMVEIAVHLRQLRCYETALQYLRDAQCMASSRMDADGKQVCEIIKALRSSLPA